MRAKNLQTTVCNETRVLPGEVEPKMPFAVPFRCTDSCDKEKKASTPYKVLYRQSAKDLSLSQM